MALLLIIGICINCIALAFAIGYNMGADRTGELKKFNDSKSMYLSTSVRKYKARKLEY